MKVLELELKKHVIIVEIPRLADYEFINKECKYLKVGNEEIKLNISTLDKLEFLCKGSELTEEIASEFFEHDDFLNCFEAYIDTVPSIDESALKLLIKIFESKGFHWLENPIEHPKDYEVFPDSLSLFAEQEKLHLEAEEKTFKNPLIFIKNYVQ